MIKFYKKAIHIFAWGGLTSAFIIVLVTGMWLIMPYNILNVTEPIKIMNPNQVISASTPILLRMSYTKHHSYPARTYPSLICQKSGVINLAPTESNLPIGTNTIDIDSIVVPERVNQDDECQFSQTIVYRVNPIREIRYTDTSEYFVVK